MEVGIILGQDAYELKGPLDYMIGTRSEPFAVLTELGWVVKGPITGKRRQNVGHFAFTEDVKVAEKIQPGSSVSQSRNCMHKRCRRVRKSLQTSDTELECRGVN